MPPSQEGPTGDADALFRVGAVVTTFRPDASLLENLKALVGQVEHVIVVDDGSGSETDEVLSRAESVGARVVRLPENVGIASALNAGVDLLLAGDAGRAPDGIVFFDQDSQAPQGFVRSLIDAHLAASRAGIPVAATAPEYFAGTVQAHGERDGILLARHPIQSGLLVASVALNTLGPFRDGLFIDLVDTEYSLRAETHGFAMVAARGLDLPHALGRRVGVPLLGRPLRGRSGAIAAFTVSAPFRYYYRARNRVIVNRLYARRRPLALARATLLELRHYVIVWLAVRERRAFAAVLRAGLADGRRRRAGRIPRDVARAAAGIGWRVPL